MSLALQIGGMVVHMICCNLWSGKLKNFSVWRICNVVSVVCHDEIDGCNLYKWSVSIMSYSCGGCKYPNAMTFSGLCMNCNDSNCNACKNEIVIWINFACPCLHGSVLNLI